MKRNSKAIQERNYKFDGTNDDVHTHELKLIMRAWTPLFMCFLIFMGFIWLVFASWLNQMNLVATLLCLCFELFLLASLWVFTHQFIKHFKDLIIYDLRKGII
jgi:hypothetical protein